jgi:hypothetical protein
MKRSLKTEISTSRPLLIINSPYHEDLDENARIIIERWHEFDDDIKPSVTFQIDGLARDNFRRNEVLLPHMEREGVPITLQVQTNNSNVDDTVPFDMVRRFVDTYSCINGLQIVESTVRTYVGHGGGPEYTMGRNARYARDIIRLAGEYGLFMSWQHMTENIAAIGCSIDNEALFDTVCEYGDYVIPTHEMNCETSKYIDHLSAMGMWLSGATARWGVEPQSWYWHDAGYNTPGSFQPPTLDMPSGMYAIMMLLGASAGATVYSIEPGPDIWAPRGSLLEPVFRRLIKERLIPSRREVVESMPIAYHLPRCEKPVDFHRISEDLDFDRNEGKLIRATYGVFDRARDAEAIPNTPRYGWIPVLPTKTPDSVLDQFDRILRPGELESVEHASKVADAHFPPVDRGDAWSTVLDTVTIAANTHENWYAPESVKLDVPRRPTGLTITPNPDGCTLSWQRVEGDRAYCVWRMSDGVESCLTPDSIESPSFTLTDANDADSYAVSAITDARESLEGILHLHEFLLLSNTESRRSAWMNLSGESVERHRIGEVIANVSQDVAQQERRSAACTIVEDLTSPEIAQDDPDASIKHEVMDAMLGWKQAIESEDLDAILAWYADDYREPDGRTKESVEVVFRSILRGYMSESTDILLKEWGSAAAWRYPAVRLFVREWLSTEQDHVEVDTIAEMLCGGGPEMEPSDMIKHPFAPRSKDLRMTWQRTPDGWRIYRTTPAFIRMEDTGIYRFRYQGW